MSKSTSLSKSGSSSSRRQDLRLPPITVDAIARMQFKSTLETITPEMRRVEGYVRELMNRAWELFPVNIFNTRGNNSAEVFCDKLKNRALNSVTKAKSVIAHKSPIFKPLIEAGIKIAYQRALGCGSCDTYQSTLMTLLLCDPANGNLADYKLMIVTCRTDRPKMQMYDPYAEHICLALVNLPSADHVLLLNCDLRKIDIIKMSEFRDCLGMYCREPHSERLAIERLPVNVTFPYTVSIDEWTDVTELLSKLAILATERYDNSELFRKVMNGVDEHIQWWSQLVATQHGIDGLIV